MYAGTVGWFGVPSVPIATGSPFALFTTRTASAPAFCAFRIFAENVQVPREMSAIVVPGVVMAGRAEQAWLRLVPDLITTNVPVRFSFTVGKSPAAAPYVFPPTVTGEPMKWPTVDAPAVNA